MEGDKSNSLSTPQAAAVTKATNGKPVFTFLQLQEFAHQALIFRHMAAGIPVPFHLVVPIQSALYSSFMGCREGDSKNSMEEPERPGRCRKTDGKKWRCSRDVVPERMFCESHTNRGRNRLRKRRHVESPYQNASSSTTNSTPSPDLQVDEVGQVLIGNPGGGSFTFQQPAQHVPQTAELGLTESGPSRFPILESTLFDDDDIELVEISAPVGERASGASGAGSAYLPQSNVAPSSEKGKRVLVDLAGMDMSTDEAIYQWACKHHLLAVPAEETDLSLNAEVREKMWVTQHDRIYNNLTFTPAPPASVAEMTSLVDGQAYFFPQFALAMLSQNQQYCYQLYQLHKLKAAKYEALYRSVDTDLVAKREEVCNLQQQLLQDHQYKDRADLLEQEAEGLRKELANIKVDLEKTAPNAQLIEKLSTLQKELETSKTEVVSLRDQLSYSEGLVSSTEQRATLAETKARNLRFEVHNVRAQALAATSTHVQDVARIKAEARSNHRTKVNAILTKVNAETGKNYQLMP